MIKKLWPLAIGGLALGATEFLIMGLLRVIGEDMGLPHGAFFGGGYCCQAISS